MPPLPILVVSNEAQIVGGGEISLLALLGDLDRTRWAPTVAVPCCGEMAARVTALGLPVVEVPLPRLASPQMLRAVSQGPLSGVLQRTRARLIHANGSRAAFYAGVAGRRLKLPVLWHCRVADPDPVLDRCLGPLATRIIVTSGAVAQRVRRWAHKTRVISNGVDLHRFAPQPDCPALRRRLGIPTGAPIIASCGRLEKGKGFDHLLSAFLRVKAVCPGVHWLHLGDGPERGRLLARVAVAGVRERVHFAGIQSDIPAFFAVAAVVAVPSLTEAFGRVVIEAMAMARPVVASAVGGLPEIVHPATGLLVPPADPRALAAALLALLANPRRSAQLGAIGRLHVSACFSAARHVQAIDALYAEVIPRDPPHAAAACGTGLDPALDELGAHLAGIGRSPAPGARLRSLA